MGLVVGPEEMEVEVLEKQHAERKALVASEAKGRFLATMSHELRTPLNAVLGMNGMLLNTKMSRQQREYANVVKTSGDALLMLINECKGCSNLTDDNVCSVLML